MAGCKWLWRGVVCALLARETAAQTASLPDRFSGYYIHLQRQLPQDDVLGEFWRVGELLPDDRPSRPMSDADSLREQHGDIRRRRVVYMVPAHEHITRAPDRLMTAQRTKPVLCNHDCVPDLPVWPPVQQQAFCWENWDAFTVYRELPTPTTSRSGSHTAFTATEGSMVNAPTASSTSGDAQNHSSGVAQPANKGWVAGAVVGPVVGVALGVVGVLFGYRKMPQARQMQALAASPYQPVVSQAVSVHVHQ
ncbi:hypothetical protein BJX96DRAFT_174064 [Aspergillus floccosus]